ncbi:transketolase [Bdellovibrio sp. HCB185ZH]|uniref:transketolase n=1 Tax=Bdellovibrio sp. HCB185ZH TaxID=3394235 RepID=UPI0039A751D9
MMTHSELKKLAHDTRTEVLEMCIEAGTGHVTSSMSAVEILISLYFGGLANVNPLEPKWSGRDRVIISKGQCSPLIYSVLSSKGFFPKDWLQGFAQKNGNFGVHLQNSVPGVELTTGALGHGLGVAAGVALAAKMNRDLHMVYCLLGDGELYEGSIWESAMFAAHNQLNNLVVIVDRNFMATTDFTENMVALEPLDKKFESFGFNVITVNGHSMEALINSMQGLRSRKYRQPTVIIAETTKGAGIQSMSHIPVLHGVPPQGPKGIDQARKDLAKGII